MKTTTYKNVEGLNRALRKLPKEASNHLRDASQRIAGDISEEARKRARSLGGQAALVAPFIRARRDRVPVVVMGGSARLPTSGIGWQRDRKGNRQTVGDIMWGAEWGSARYLQFPRPVTLGRFLWTTVHEESDHMMETWGDALGDAMRAI